jgi:hypothetical protein
MNEVDGLKNNLETIRQQVMTKMINDFSSQAYNIMIVG